MKSFKDLLVWQRAHALTLSVYEMTAALPREEKFGLQSQIRRASSSIAANIAEGCGRGSNPEFARFLQMAMGSASETEYHLILAKDLKLLADSDFKKLEAKTEEVKRMLASLIGKVKVPN
jgi:four helix bundle protein